MKWGKRRRFWFPGRFDGGRMEDDIKTGRTATDRTAKDRTATGRTATDRMAIVTKVKETPHEWKNAC